MAANKVDGTIYVPTAKAEDGTPMDGDLLPFIDEQDLIVWSYS